MPSPPSQAPPASPPPAAASSPPRSPTNTTTTSSPSDEANLRFPPAEEASLLTQSNDLKANANTTFARGDFSTAISEYDKALTFCPNYLDYEIAVLKSNIAACHLKLEDWKAAVGAADAALEGIARLLKPAPPPAGAAAASSSRKNQKKKQADTDDDDTKHTGGEGHQRGGRAVDDDDDEEEEEHDDVVNTNNNNDNDRDAAAAVVVELPDHLDETAALARLNQADARHRAIARIRAKSLMRRARAKCQLGGWANLQAAQDDYTALSAMPAEVLPPQDKRVVQAALRELPAKVAGAREAEMGEMMGKLKELGNSVLKPFGLSTDMFKMQKDEKTGGYSMSINQEN